MDPRSRLAVAATTVCWLAFAACVQAQGADKPTGVMLLETCQSVLQGVPKEADWHDGKDVAECYAYIHGFWDALQLSKNFNPTLLKEVCFPSEVTLGQQVRVVAKFLEDHPEKLHLHRAFLVGMAFADAFPCEDSE